MAQTSADSSVRALSLSRFCPDSRKIVSGVYLVLVSPMSVRCLSGFCSVSILSAVLILSVRPDKDEKELSGLSPSLSADVWTQPYPRRAF